MIFRLYYTTKNNDLWSFKDFMSFHDRREFIKNHKLYLKNIVRYDSPYPPDHQDKTNIVLPTIYLNNIEVL